MKLLDVPYNDGESSRAVNGSLRSMPTQKACSPAPVRTMT